MLVVGLAGGIVSGVIGTGSSIVLLPVLVFAFGPKQAVPIMAVASVIGNVSRVLAWWREVDWRAFLVYGGLGAPAAALGARTLLVLPVTLMDLALASFFLLMVPGRRLLLRRDLRLSLPQLGAAGGAIGFLTGLVLSTGPLSVPAFLAYGLVKGPLLATEGATAALIYVVKVATFGSFGALPLAVLFQGVLVGSTLMAGAFLGREVVRRMSTEAFEFVLDAVLIVSGLSLLGAAYVDAG